MAKQAACAAAFRVCKSGARLQIFDVMRCERGGAHTSFWHCENHRALSLTSTRLCIDVCVDMSIDGRRVCAKAPLESSRRGGRKAYSHVDARTPDDGRGAADG